MKLLLSLSMLLSLSTAASSEFKYALHQELKMSHIEVGSYKEARTYVLGHLFVQEGENREYFIETTYCNSTISGDEVGPGKLPSNKLLQTEHVWSQSKFSQDEETRKLQKKDLFNLVPITKLANMVRGNTTFGNVVNGKPLIKECDSLIGNDFFEPRDEVKGDIARIMFYFSTRYNVVIDDEQEEVLRKWNSIDPVSEVEESLNDRISEIQGTRNPFIDFPQFVNLIENF